jgi:hypothetical protein
MFLEMDFDTEIPYTPCALLSKKWFRATIRASLLIRVHQHWLALSNGTMASACRAATTTTLLQGSHFLIKAINDVGL